MVLVAGWGTTCEAKLGMKMEDLEKAYKQPVSTNSDAGMIVRTYHVIGEDITVTYLDGVSVCESILSGPDDLKMDEPGAVSMGGIVSKQRQAKWERRKDLETAGRKAWSVKDDYFVLWDFAPRSPDRLTVYNHAYAEKSEALKKK